MSVQSLRRKLAALRARVALALWLDGTSRVAASLFTLVAASFLLDRVFRLELAARVVLLIGLAAGLGYAVWRFLWSRLRRLPGEDPLAVAVERAHPELRDRLISAIQLSREPDPERYGMSRQLVEDAIAAAEEPASRVKFSSVLDARRLSKAALAGLAAIALLSAGAAADPESASIWFQRNVLLRDVRWPQKTYLEVDGFPGGVARVVRGGDLVVSARSVGELHPERVTVFWEDESGESGQAPMKADLEGRVYRHEFTQIAAPLVFHLEGGDEITRDFAVELMEPPDATDVVVTVAFPAYARREPVVADLSSGDVEMLRGGSIAVRGKSTKPLSSAELVVGEAGETPIAARLLDERSFEAEFAPDATALVGVRLRDADGLSNPSLAPRFLVRVVEDRAPKVRLRLRGIGPMVVSVASIPYAISVRDDVRAVAGRLEVQKTAGGGEPPPPVLLGFPPDALGAGEHEMEGVLEVASLDAGEGSFLSLTAFASDEAQPEAHEGASDPVSVKVVSYDVFLSEMLRRQQELRRGFEELVVREKALQGRFQSLRADATTPPDRAREELESEAREQRLLARNVETIEKAFHGILDEMANNHVHDVSRITTLRNRVAGAMSRLREGAMTAQAQALDALAARREVPAGQDAQRADDGYAAILQAMDAILQDMEKVESFTEIVEMLRGIISLHDAIAEDTRKRLEADLRDIFKDPQEGGGEEGR